MGEMKPTPGPWEATCSNENGYYPEWFIRVPGEPPVISYEIAKIASYRPDGTDESDARLIAEAGTVFHSTGLSPVQLVEQRDELLAALKDLLNEVDEDGIGASKNFGWQRVTEKARAALAKCEGVK